MGVWRDLSAPVAAGLLLVMVAPSSKSAGPASLPAGQSENAVSPPRAGRVAPTPGQAEAPLKDVLTAVRTDAAAAFGVPVAGVRVQVEEVVWSDGALGCAAPGMLATQAQVPGWRFTVEASPSWTAAYHASKQGQWRLCRSGILPGASVSR